MARTPSVVSTSYESARPAHLVPGRKPEKKLRSRGFWALIFWGLFYSLFAPRIVPFIGHPPEHNIRLFLQLYGSLKIFVFSLLLVTMSLSITHTFYFPAWNSDQHSLPFFPTQSATTLSLVSEQPVQYFAVLL